MTMIGTRITVVALAGLMLAASPALADALVHSNPTQASSEMRQKMQSASPVDTGCANGLSKVTYPECTFTVKKRGGEPDDQK